MYWEREEILYAKRTFGLQLYGNGLFMQSIDATELLSESIAALVRAGLNKDPMAVQLCAKLNPHQPWILQIIRHMSENDSNHPLYPVWARHTAMQKLLRK
jgi:hypothetical protein